MVTTPTPDDPGAGIFFPLLSGQEVWGSVPSVHWVIPDDQ